jgi:hypothetical protein
MSGNPFDAAWDGAHPANSTPAPRSQQQSGNPFDHAWDAHSASPGSQAQLDPAHRQAREWIDSHPEARHGFANSMAGKLVQGMTMGWGDEALAAAAATRDALKHGKNWTESYNLEKAMQDEQLNDATRTTGGWGTAAEVAGGIASGAGLAGRGVTLMREGQGLGMRSLAGAAEGAGYGAVSGAGSEEDGGRIAGGINGALMGGALGGALPSAIEVARHTPLASTAVSALHSAIDPRGFAEGKIGQALRRSGLSADEVTDNIARAQGQGQDFVLADALGNSGQRLLAATTKQPGEARTAVDEFLNTRQEGSADRVGSYIDEALGADMTGRQTRAALQQRARQNSRPLYEASDAYPIQWTQETENFLNEPLIQRAMNEGIETQRLSDLARNPGSHDPANFSIQGYNNAASQPGVQAAGPNMRTLDAIKQGLDGMLEKYRDPITRRLSLDPQGAAIEQLRSSFVEHLDNLNPLYRDARRAYGGPAAEREAVDMGMKAASRGRAADNLDAFNSMSPTQQSGFRVGYADTVNEAIERSNPNANHAARFNKQKARQELEALSLHQGPRRPGEPDLLRQRLVNEQIMHTTRNHALGGSPTAENLADMADLGIGGASAVGHALSGNWGGAIRDVAGWIFGNGGNTEAMRSHLANMLLSGHANLNGLPQGLRPLLQRAGIVGPNANPNNLRGLLNLLEQQNRNLDRAGAHIRRAVSSGGVPAALEESGQRRRGSGPFSVLYNSNLGPAIVGGRR